MKRRIPSCANGSKPDVQSETQEKTSGTLVPGGVASTLVPRLALKRYQSERYRECGRRRTRLCGQRGSEAFASLSRHTSLLNGNQSRDDAARISLGQKTYPNRHGRSLVLCHSFVAGGQMPVSIRARCHVVRVR
jgi:hypothetical protein